MLFKQQTNTSACWERTHILHPREVPRLLLTGKTHSLTWLVSVFFVCSSQSRAPTRDCEPHCLKFAGPPVLQDVLQLAVILWGSVMVVHAASLSYSYQAGLEANSTAELLYCFHQGILWQLALFTEIPLQHVKCQLQSQ